MKLSEIREFKKFCAGLPSAPNWREVLENGLDTADDFTVDNVRFIRTLCVEDILEERLQNNKAFLGMIKPEILAGVLQDVPIEVFKILQGVSEYAVLGDLIVRSGNLPVLRPLLTKEAGYSWFFGADTEFVVDIDDVEYIVFDMGKTLSD